MWRYVFGESERCRNDVLVQEIDVVALWVCWIIVEGQVASQHGVLSMVRLWKQGPVQKTYQDNTTTPDIDFAASVERVADDKLWGCVTGASTAGLHEIAAASVRLVKAHLPYKVLISQPVFNLLAQLILGVEGVGETEISDDDVLVAIQQQVLQLEISVDDTPLVQIAHSGYELGK